MLRAARRLAGFSAFEMNWSSHPFLPDILRPVSTGLGNALCRGGLGRGARGAGFPSIRGDSAPGSRAAVPRSGHSVPRSGGSGLRRGSSGLRNGGSGPRCDASALRRGGSGLRSHGSVLRRGASALRSGYFCPPLCETGRFLKEKAVFSKAPPSCLPEP